MVRAVVSFGPQLRSGPRVVTDGQVVGLFDRCGFAVSGDVHGVAVGADGQRGRAVVVAVGAEILRDPYRRPAGGLVGDGRVVQPSPSYLRGSRHEDQSPIRA